MLIAISSRVEHTARRASPRSEAISADVDREIDPRWSARLETISARAEP
jgi:hypothetical protein